MKFHKIKAIVSDRKTHMGDVSAMDYILIALAKYGPMKIYSGSRTPLIGDKKKAIKAGEINIQALGSEKVTTSDGDHWRDLIAMPGATHTITDKGLKRIKKYKGTAAWDYV